MKTNFAVIHWRAVFWVSRCCIIVALAFATGPIVAQQSDDALGRGFLTPPDSAKPRVWWHWMNGNVAEKGVRLDFEWMKRVGIGGVTNIDVGLEFGGAWYTPPQVEKPLAYLTPEWRQAFRYSVGLANELNLEFAVDSSPGWSESGGPWVKPQQAMKKLVWSETFVQGGRPFEGRLAKPPETTGLFQNIPLVELGAWGGANSETPVYYADVATIAYRAPASEVPFASLEPAVTSNAGAIDAARLWDGDLATAVSLPFGKDRDAWIQFSFAKPQRIQAVTAVVGPPSLGLNPVLEIGEGGRLEASDDGRTFRKVTDLPNSGAPEKTVSFPPIVARDFRVVLERPEPSALAQAGFVAPPVAHKIAELVLHSGARVNRFEDKAGYSSRQIIDEDDTPVVAAGDVVPKSDVVDLTSRMRSDGSLEWTPPAGRWIVLRFGYSLLGHTNQSASRAGRGLEVDKLSREYVKSYIDTYLGEYEKTLGPELIGRHGLQYVVMDSYEVGVQNWTDDLLEQFRQRRGYDALLWLPVLAGRVIESAAASDRFLWDFRKTLSDLIAEAHYGQIAASLHQRGLGLYEESHEGTRAFVGDGMEVKKTADIPMGAMWASSGVVVHTSNDHDVDIRESASVAHIYGKNLVAAESFTVMGNPYGFAPETLKPIADRELAMGLNRFVIHTSVHQPGSKPGPGISLGPVGQWFTRKETWAEQAGSWVGYLTRSSYLLQQGRFVADIAYLYGEDTNVTSLFDASAAPVPDGYGFDFVNPDALLNELSVKSERLATRAGMEYRVLALDASTHRMSLPMLRKIRDLVRAGALVVGARPTGTPSLADDEGEFRAIVAELWGETPGERTVGASKVIADRSLAEALAAMHIPPDVTFTKPPDAELRFVHRALEDGDLYFVSSGTAQAQAVEASFRVSGKLPELWRADTGTIAPLSYRMENGRTIVPLKLDPNDAVFVVFRHPTSAQSVVIPEPTAEVLAALEGPWEVSFPPDLGAPARARFDSLNSWTENTDAGVKYFSGTAAYNKTVPIPQEWLKEGSRMQLDLGTVKNLAEVLVNGRSFGVLWKTPFKLDITGALKAGDNRFEIKVTNLWPNRLIGDKQPDARKIAFATFDPFKADSPLRTSVLVGPVTLSRVSPGWNESSAASAQTGPPSTITTERFTSLQTIRLWPGAAPGAKGDTPADVPSITVFRPALVQINGTAVIVAPGGSYIALVSDLEGREVADWFAARGVTAFLLNYRLGKRYPFPVAMTDAQRAIRVVRANAKRWGLFSDKIGMIGFSAGGHLTAMTGTSFTLPDANASDPVERESDRPDFLILCYPGISMMDLLPNGSSIYCQLVHIPNCDPRDYARFVPDNLVRADTPPTFLCQASDDASAAPENSIRFYRALSGKGVPAELHIFAKGGHGFGLGGGDPNLDAWPILLEAWLRQQGLLVRPSAPIFPVADDYGPLSLESSFSRLLRNPRAHALLEQYLGRDALASEVVERAKETTIPAREIVSFLVLTTTDEQMQALDRSLRALSYQ